MRWWKLVCSAATLEGFSAPEPFAPGGSVWRPSWIAVADRRPSRPSTRNRAGRCLAGDVHARSAMAVKMYVVSRAKPELYERLSTYLAADEATRVIIDRRKGERRGPEAAAADRRRRDLSGDLQNRGWAIVEFNGSHDESE